MHLTRLLIKVARLWRLPVFLLPFCCFSILCVLSRCKRGGWKVACTKQQDLGRVFSLDTNPGSSKVHSATWFIRLPNTGKGLASLSTADIQPVHHTEELDVNTPCVSCTLSHSQLPSCGSIWHCKSTMERAGWRDEENRLDVQTDVVPRT